MSRISYLSELLSSVFARDESQHQGEGQGSLSELCDALLSQRGEMSGHRLARGLLNRFAAADPDEQLVFFRLMADRYDINAEHALRAAQRYSEEKSADNLSILMESVEPRRQELLRRLNRVPGATNELVRMRAQLLAACREHPELRCIDVDFQHLFRSWFNRGFLVLREIDWHSPASILEKIIAYEAVHAINSWSSLRSRLEPDDRRCFAFFHPAMVDEPLIFVEVALTRSTPTSIRQVLQTTRDIVPQQEATTAVFYSISNCQKGLAGVSFGNFLIKQVAQELSRQLPNLEIYRTLSPVPGLMRWVDKALDSAELQPAAAESEVAEEQGRLHDALQTAQRIAAMDTFELIEGDNEHLKFLTAHYLKNEKRADKLPLDPVARFHLGNGASLDQVLPAADVFRKGLSQSAGVMVSYLYDLDKVEDNHEAYANENVVKVSQEVDALLARPKRTLRRA
ncbi:malonyl-CoA decarboxylase [Granulosicoccus sp. 3-233]|uniref:malonyl-CoA decarboxylase n=1 Tax=Granulosicoccus sp. 3-233 TaxID=3417969 RepID=UPI003D32B887